MTQYYHTPIPLLAPAAAATFRSPFGELDAAIYRCLGSGTSFPLSPTEGDQFWRTDSNLGYLYNGSGWVEISTGGASAGVVDVEGTAGEALSERDIVYCNSVTPDGKWYKVDIDATAVVKASSHIGVVAESGGILNAATGTIRVYGVLGGFTGLTAGGLVYAHTTAGGYTQTKPAVTDGGAQKAIVIVGQAISTTEVLVVRHVVEYAKRATLNNNDTLTIEHHADASTRTRLASATIITSEAGLSLTSYSDTNQDVGVPLRGPSGAGSTTTVAATGSGQPLGENGGSNYSMAQGFQITAGRLSQITLVLGTNTGSPTGTVTWEIQTDSGGKPSNTVLQTGTFTPVADSTNTISVTNGIFLSTATNYQLVFKSTNLQSSGNRWNIVTSTSSVYADGTMSYATSPYTSWTSSAVTDLDCTITTAPVSVGDKLSQGFQVTGAQTPGSVKLYLEKVGTPTGTMTLRIETDAAGSPSGTLVDAAATTTLAESSLGTSYGWITFAFATSFNVSGSTQYHVVVSTDRSTSTSNYILWGSDASSPSYASGEMKSEASSTWSAESKDACFDVLGENTTYDEPCTIGRWSGGTRDTAVRFDDGAAASAETKTTFKNVIGSSVDMTCIVRMP